MPKRVRDTAGEEQLEPTISREALEDAAEVAVDAVEEWREAEALAAELAGDGTGEHLAEARAVEQHQEDKHDRRESALDLGIIHPDDSVDDPSFRVRVIDTGTGEEADMVMAPPPASTPEREISEASAYLPLERVKAAGRARKRYSKKLEDATSELQAAVREARDAGGSLRGIASHAGVSYDTIDRWTKE